MLSGKPVRVIYTRGVIIGTVNLLQLILMLLLTLRTWLGEAENDKCGVQHGNVANRRCFQYFGYFSWIFICLQQCHNNCCVKNRANGREKTLNVRENTVKNVKTKK